MNVLYLLGNGFDLRLGLPTRYEDFLSYYKEQVSLYHKDNELKAQSVLNYKSLLYKRMETAKQNGEYQWKDLELALGKLTAEFGNDVEGFRDFYQDINESLERYLLSINFREPSQEESEKLRYDLLYPYKVLSSREQREFLGRFNSTEHWNINVVTFNYTSTFEYLSENVLSVGTQYTRYSTLDTSYYGVRHIHGKLGESDILFGVDNSEQIDNHKFKDDFDVTDFLLKPQGNVNVGSLVDDECQQLISEAGLICLFGLSLGETDKIWWNAIKQRFLEIESVVILYFHYEPSEIPLNLRDKQPFRKARQHLLDALDIEGKQEDYQHRIFVAVNSDIFPKR